MEKIKDRKEPIEMRISRLENSIQELITTIKQNQPTIHNHYYADKELTQEDWLRIMNKPPMY